MSNTKVQPLIYFYFNFLFTIIRLLGFQDIDKKTSEFSHRVLLQIFRMLMTGESKPMEARSL